MRGSGTNSVLESMSIQDEGKSTAFPSEAVYCSQPSVMRIFLFLGKYSSSIGYIYLSVKIASKAWHTQKAQDNCKCPNLECPVFSFGNLFITIIKA